MQSSKKFAVGITFIASMISMLLGFVITVLLGRYLGARDEILAVQNQKGFLKELSLYLMKRITDRFFWFYGKAGIKNN